MLAKQMSPSVILTEIDTARAFYEKYFDAKTLFDAGFYLVLKVGAAEFAMMVAGECGSAPYGGAGLIYNFQVDDVDKEYDRLITQGLEAVMPLEDHPWGDRGFSIDDPNGISLYIYTEKEPDESFKQFYKG